MQQVTTVSTLYAKVEPTVPQFGSNPVFGCFFLTHLCKCNQIFLKVQVIGVTEESSALQTVFVQTFK